MQFFLRCKYTTGRLHDVAFFGHRRHFHHTTPQLTLQEFKTTAGVERLGCRPHDRQVATGTGFAPGQCPLGVRLRNTGEFTQSTGAHCQHIGV